MLILPAKKVGFLKDLLSYDLFFEVFSFLFGFYSFFHNVFQLYTYSIPLWQSPSKVSSAVT